MPPCSSCTPATNRPGCRACAAGRPKADTGTARGPCSPRPLASGREPLYRFNHGGVRAWCAPRPPALFAGRGKPANGCTGRGWNARTKPRQCVGRPALCPAAPSECFAKCKFSAPARGLKIGLKKPNFAKPAHLATHGGGCGLGAGRSGRSAAGRTGVRVSKTFRDRKSPRLYRRGLFVNFACRSKVSG